MPSRREQFNHLCEERLNVVAENNMRWSYLIKLKEIVHETISGTNSCNGTFNKLIEWGFFGRIKKSVIDRWCFRLVSMSFSSFRHISVWKCRSPFCNCLIDMSNLSIYQNYFTALMARFKCFKSKRITTIEIGNTQPKPLSIQHWKSKENANKKLRS